MNVLACCAARLHFRSRSPWSLDQDHRGGARRHVERIENRPSDEIVMICTMASEVEIRNTQRRKEGFGAIPL